MPTVEITVKALDATGGVSPSIIRAKGAKLVGADVQEKKASSRRADTWAAGVDAWKVKNLRA